MANDSDSIRPLPIPILSDQELNEMFYGPGWTRPPGGIGPPLGELGRPNQVQECDKPLTGTDQFACAVLSVVVLFGGWGVLYVLYRIGSACLGRLGL